MHNKPFLNTYLRLAPDFKALALGFYNGQYGTVLQLLDVVRPLLQFDVYLHAHLDELLGRFRDCTVPHLVRRILRHRRPHPLIWRPMFLQR